MKIKIVSLSLLVLGICSLAIAAEYESPDVGFTPRSAPSKIMKAADFGDHYRVETGMGNDRQIASETESDREPSSVVPPKDKKVVEPENADGWKEGPKPWLLKQKDSH